jgi:glutaredoxin 3
MITTHFRRSLRILNTLCPFTISGFKLAQHFDSQRSLSHLIHFEHSLNLAHSSFRFMSSSASLQVPENIETYVQECVKSHSVMVFSKTYCPYCTKVKDLFSNTLNIPYHVIELDQDVQGPKIQDYLRRWTGQKTVPNVFIHGQHVGGCDSTFAAYHDGRLGQLLRKATKTMEQEPMKVQATLPEVISQKEGSSIKELEKLKEEKPPSEMDVTLSSKKMISDESYDYDLIILGGGSGGLSCAREGKRRLGLSILRRFLILFI